MTPISLPVATLFVIVGVLDPIASPFDDEKALVTARVFRLIPLVLFVADKASLVGPAIGVGSSRRVEFVCPDEGVGRRIMLGGFVLCDGDCRQ